MTSYLSRKSALGGQVVSVSTKIVAILSDTMKQARSEHTDLARLSAALVSILKGRDMNQTYQVGDRVLWYGEEATIEEHEPRMSGADHYFLRIHSGGHAWALETELEPCSTN
jgi:hypothetical protein